MIQLSCKHMSDDEFNTVMIKTYTERNTRAISYQCVCDSCYRNLTKEGLLLYTPEEANLWISGDLK